VGPGGDARAHLHGAASSLAFEQVIAVVAAQPGQRGGHRGLAHPDPLAGPGQVPVLEQRAQREQQVEVYLGGFGHVGRLAWLTMRCQ
jgi:hypothetical protein